MYFCVVLCGGNPCCLSAPLLSLLRILIDYVPISFGEPLSFSFVSFLVVFFVKESTVTHPNLY